ncbi:hypothetical protein LSAT2_005913, partial [Lamellibrachia satsuma]
GVQKLVQPIINRGDLDDCTLSTNQLRYGLSLVPQRRRLQSTDAMIDAKLCRQSVK